MIDAHILVLGGGQVGRRLAEDLTARGPDARRIEFIDGSETAVERAVSAGVDARHAPTIESDPGPSVTETGGDARIAILTGRSDSENLLLTQRLRTAEARVEIIVLVHDPRNREVFEALGVETVCAAETLSGAIRERLPELGTGRTQPRESDVTDRQRPDGHHGEEH